MAENGERVLIIEPDTVRAWQMGNVLVKAGFQVLAGSTADSRLVRADLHAIVVALDVDDTTRLIGEAATINPDLLVIFVAGDRSDLPDMEPTLVLHRPVVPQLLLDAVCLAQDAVGRPRSTSTLGDALQMLLMTRQRQVIEVRCGGKNGRIYVSDRSVVHATFGHYEGRPALECCLGCDGLFTLTPWVAPRRRSLHCSELELARQHVQSVGKHEARTCP